MSGLRVLSVRQPWAWAIIHGGKDVENRSRSLGPYRGPVLIHVSMKPAGSMIVGDTPLRRAQLAAIEAGDASWDAEPWWSQAGHVIGVVDLVDVHHGPAYGGGCYKLDSPVPLLPDYSACSEWGDDQAYHLVLKNPRALDRPLAWTGGLGLRKAPQLDLIGDYLAIAAEGCTCGQAGVGGPHEPACGWEPLARLEAVSRG